MYSSIKARQQCIITYAITLQTSLKLTWRLKRFIPVSARKPISPASFTESHGSSVSMHCCTASIESSLRHSMTGTSSARGRSIKERVSDREDRY